MGLKGQNGISLFAIAAWLFSFHWGIAALLLTAALPGVFVRLKQHLASYEQRKINRRK